MRLTRAKWLEKKTLVPRPHTTSSTTTASSKLLHITQSIFIQLTVRENVEGGEKVLMVVLQCLNIPTSFNLKVLWSLPRSSSLHEGCRGQPGPPSVSPRSQDPRRKYPTSTAMSPLRSDRSLHLEGRNNKEKIMYWLSGFFKFNPYVFFFLFAEVYLAWVVCVLLSWCQFYCCRWDRVALRKQETFYKDSKIALAEHLGGYAGV